MFAAGFEDGEVNAIKTSATFFFDQTVKLEIGVFNIVRIFSISLK